eukprot:TRINITY_DN6762_c0_g3_i1.p1 TRINITY_DN6762_c0_g3~~TRINITY_DN6762_c0_g3_i1.p1  ORF type:complete len:643 (-),score=111.45 TRINITY_DN6762_c0_g3_i1:313-2241(-)
MQRVMSMAVRCLLLLVCISVATAEKPKAFRGGAQSGKKIPSFHAHVHIDLGDSSQTEKNSNRETLTDDGEVVELIPGGAPDEDRVLSDEDAVKPVTQKAQKDELSDHLVSAKLVRAHAKIHMEKKDSPMWGGGDEEAETAEAETKGLDASVPPPAKAVGSPIVVSVPGWHTGEPKAKHAEHVEHVAHAPESHGHESASHGHGESHGHGHEESHGHGHGPPPAGANAVAVGLISTVVLVPLVVGMALAEGLVAELTMKLLDTFVSIFLAVLWFNCFTQALVTFEVAKAFPYAEEAFGIFQILALYAIANLVAYLWRDEKMTLITFCSCGAHYIAFAGIGVSGISQHHASEDLASGSYEPLVSFGFVIFLMACLIGVSAVNHYTWRNDVKHDRLHECIDELELDILGLMVSFVITQAVRQAITGRYPPSEHLLFMQEQGHDHYEHKAWQRWFMFGWAVGLTVLSANVLPMLNKEAHHSPVMHKVVHIFKVIMIMLVAWGFLLWGQWEFFEHLFAGDVMFGHMVFSVSATLVCLAVLYVMAQLLGDNATQDQRETMNITITGVSLVAAWSWEHCFNIAFDIIGQTYQVGYKGLVPKLFLAIVIPAVLLPTYIKHVKFRVIETEEKHHHAQHGHGDHEAGHAQAAH